MGSEMCIRDRNQITDLTPLSGLTSLTDLDLRLNCISDLFPLLGLNALVDLFLEYNPLSDTTIAEHIPQLSDNFAYVTYYPRSDEYCPASEGEGEDADSDSGSGFSSLYFYIGTKKLQKKFPAYFLKR